MKICPSCGTSSAHIEMSGRVGCIECYNLFKKEIFNIIQPSVQLMDYGLVDSGIQGYTELMIQLQQAVDKEDYEEAALLRDRLSELKESTP